MRNPISRKAVKRKSNSGTIIVTNMGHASVPREFLKILQSIIEDGFEEIEIVYQNAGSTYADVCAPIAGILDYYKIEQGLTFEPVFIPAVDNYTAKTNIHSPLSVSDNPSQLRLAPLNTVWKFSDSADVKELVDSYIAQVAQNAECAADVLKSLTWCLNEIMDNVLQHALPSSPYGYAMGQIHPMQRHLAFCVFDSGIGIYNSLKGSKYEQRSPSDAILQALQEGVTRDTKIGQGNGLWGLFNILKQNNGRLIITSGGSSFMLYQDQTRNSSNTPVLSKHRTSTVVDFQLNYSKPINLSKALGGHEPVDMRTESMLGETGDVRYSIREHGVGVGTRQSGARVLTSLVNLHSELPKSVIVIDFSDTEMISSSFADEFIGKLVARFGFYGFNKIFRLENMNPDVQIIVNRSVAQRMHSAFVLGKKD